MNLKHLLLFTVITTYSNILYAAASNQLEPTSLQYLKGLLQSHYPNQCVFQEVTPEKDRQLTKCVDEFFKRSSVTPPEDMIESIPAGACHTLLLLLDNKMPAESLSRRVPRSSNSCVQASRFLADYLVVNRLLSEFDLLGHVERYKPSYDLAHNALIRHHPQAAYLILMSLHMTKGAVAAHAITRNLSTAREMYSDLAARSWMQTSAEQRQLADLLRSFNEPVPEDPGLGTRVAVAVNDLLRWLSHP